MDIFLFYTTLANTNSPTGLSGAIRQKEEAMEIRENLEQRTEEIVSECNEWKSFGNSQKAENERLREALQSLEVIIHYYL